MAEYDDELYAYLVFQHLGGTSTFKETELLLTYRKDQGTLLHQVQTHLKNDLAWAIHLLATARAGNLIRDYGWYYVDANALHEMRYQTNVFVTAYNPQTDHKLERLSPAQLTSYLRRFILFKSSFDPRVTKSIEPIPQALTRSQAHDHASDIVAVAPLYSLPLDFLLGIGAMENDDMNVKGDLLHAVWKRRPHRGDVIVKRRKGRVLVLNPASGVWQITRETRRYVHQLYLKDRRDYTKLPAHLRPAKEVNLDEPNPETLTPYAGLLFRELLELYAGDVKTAVAAYNGGPRNPNCGGPAGRRTRSTSDRTRCVFARKASGRRAVHQTGQR